MIFVIPDDPFIHYFSNRKNMRIFALHTSQDFAEKVADFLDRSLDSLEERNFEDGEHKIRPLVSVRDEDVYVVHALYADERESVNDKLCKLLFFIATLKDAGAKRVTAVVPYLCYARKDRRTKARDPVTSRYVATLFEAVRVDTIVTIEVHNLQAYQNAFHCQSENLVAYQLFVSYFLSVLQKDEQVVVMSPDIGGVKRAEQFRDRLAKGLAADVDMAFMEKIRSKGIVSGETVVGNVNRKTVIIIDDLINSGSTIARAAAACGKLGALKVYAVATHGVFNKKAKEALREKSLTSIIVTNTVNTATLDETFFKNKLVVLDVSPLFAETIRRLNSGGSIVSLMDIE
ncbi:ribose-phosphate pyrophosphokinase [Chryseolinea sp. H1M3-3]|uniref:ribose-phosphate diphosphokinase n=1 Tax=Chryseolinea sp. H1M3-3 TaxID=3034144 RepID=UPI0023ED1815|nr:ribose-phosphate pyrophosphokinase [Chryseolinea sp. H1M3-3]